MSENYGRSNGFGCEVQRELVAKLLQASPATLVVAILAALAVSSALYSESNKSSILIWCSVVVLVSAVRIALVARWRKCLTQQNATTIANLYSFAAFVAGLCWAGSLYFYSTEIPQIHQLLILIMLTCMPPSSLVSNAYWLPVFICFSLPLWIAVIVWAVLFGGGKQIQLLVIFLAYITLMLMIAKKTGETFKKLVYEGYKNRQLVREVREMNDKLNLLAYEDPLTRLANRRQFEEKAVEAMRLLEDMHISEIVLLMIDVDNFKGVNDRLGHDAGDELLKAISNRMMEMSRHSEVVVQGQMDTARIGGDEFAVMYCIDKNSAPSSIDKLAQRILNALSEAISFEKEVFWPSVSIGVARAPAHATDFAHLRRYADLSMYQAKKEGGNRVCIYQQS